MGLCKQRKANTTNFKNKVVIVTGASSGIGAATAIKFASAGADVVIVGRNEKKLEEVSRKCKSKGKKPLTIAADLTNDESVKKVIKETISKYGKLDILINNAGKSNHVGILDENAMNVFDDLVNTNLRSVVHLTILAAPHLVKTKGNIINISSVASLIVDNGAVAYCTSKAGLDHFTRSVALELAAEGVRVNSINPGPVKTDIIANMGMPKAVSDKIFEGFSETTALGRVSEPEEIADLVIYLASDEARSITGSAYVIDNGLKLSGVPKTDEIPK